MLLCCGQLQGRSEPAATLATARALPPAATPSPPPPWQAIEALYGSQHAAQRSTYAAFYSSELGGIVTDPALMVVQLDDHMVHRGHAGGAGAGLLWVCGVWCCLLGWVCRAALHGTPLARGWQGAGLLWVGGARCCAAD